MAPLSLWHLVQIANVNISQTGAEICLQLHLCRGHLRPSKDHRGGDARSTSGPSLVQKDVHLAPACQSSFQPSDGSDSDNCDWLLGLGFRV